MRAILGLYFMTEKVVTSRRVIPATNLNSHQCSVAKTCYLIIHTCMERMRAGIPNAIEVMFRMAHMIMIVSEKARKLYGWRLGGRVEVTGCTAGCAFIQKKWYRITNAAWITAKTEGLL